MSAKEVLGIACSTELHAPILSQHDPRWARLRFDRVPGVDLRDHFRGAPIDGAIGDAMAVRTQARGRVLFPQAALCSESARLKSNQPLEVSEAAASKCRVVVSPGGKIRYTQAKVLRPVPYPFPRGKALCLYEETGASCD